MSAIVGIMQLQGSKEHLRRDLQYGLAALTNYGPEGKQYWVEGCMALGHQNMVITPEDNLECLPTYDRTTHLAITADVRLDNREDLGTAFDISPSELTHTPDSTLILLAYQKWGKACPLHLLGDFAFAIWNNAEHTLFCARDHIGTKPFYYSLTSERFVFASDINGVLAIPSVSQKLNEPYIAAHIQTLHFMHKELTFFENIHKLPPAHSLTLWDDNHHLERYWAPEQLSDNNLSSETEYIEAFLDIYQRAVAARLRTVHPVGMHVSGGLDSSSIVVLASRILRQQGKPLYSFSWAPPPEDESSTNDEHVPIKAICEQEGLSFEYQDLSVDHCISLLGRNVTREPTIDTLLSEERVQEQAVKHQIRVMLSGWGGDELITFNGLGYYMQLFRQRQWPALAREIRAPGGNVLRRLLRNVVVPLAPDWCQTAMDQFFPGLLLFPSPNKMESYIHPAFASRMRQQVKSLAPKPLSIVGVRQTQLQLFNLGHLTQRIEHWAANAARYQMVYHYPLLDRRIIEFALRLPSRFFRKGKWDRWFARQAMSNFLPASVAWNRDKTDPARVRQFRNLQQEALISLGYQLAAGANLPAHAEYLNSSRLQNRLTSGRIIESNEARSLWWALQFLGASQNVDHIS